MFNPLHFDLNETVRVTRLAGTKSDLLGAGLLMLNVEKFQIDDPQACKYFILTVFCLIFGFHVLCYFIQFGLDSLRLIEI